ncbi:MULTISPECIES: hypothetical protein [Streptomyces]|uniref:hypothetical protein n=1 Tax=Streptomyces TaxID=1883 RepID=UPI00163C3F10|nr:MULTISPECIES: hypothetical protein [Streptomyces]MBC2877439.1 hypothetical protein [Streptomyces sp. TYQ1024]UBI38237.1 hypothetical protein K7I03_18445 [Streptomyces mobaraensis]UKW30823.1 hypothetical protein MCU78_18405 [Streptomyces sp. TYQ1024]
MDLLDWHRGTLSSRRLAVLVAHLPRDSAVNRALHGEAADWDASTHLLAAVVDHLAVANWLTATLAGDEDADPLPYPEPVPRPGDEETPDEPSGPGEPVEPDPPEALARLFA